MKTRKGGKRWLYTRPCEKNMDNFELKKVPRKNGKINYNDPSEEYKFGDRWVEKSYKNNSISPNEYSKLSEIEKKKYRNETINIGNGKLHYKKEVGRTDILNTNEYINKTCPEEKEFREKELLEKELLEKESERERKREIEERNNLRKERDKEFRERERDGKSFYREII